MNESVLLYWYSAIQAVKQSIVRFGRILVPHAPL